MLYAFKLGRKLRGEEPLTLKKAVKAAHQAAEQKRPQEQHSTPQTCKTNNSIA